MEVTCVQVFVLCDLFAFITNPSSSHEYCTESRLCMAKSKMVDLKVIVKIIKCVVKFKMADRDKSEFAPQNCVRCGA